MYVTRMVYFQISMPKEPPLPVYSMVLLDIPKEICQPLQLVSKVVNPSCNDMSPHINCLNTVLSSICSILSPHCPRTREAVLGNKSNIRCETLCAYLDNKEVCLMSHSMFSKC